jgi:type IV pilus assembly protein PilC
MRAEEQLSRVVGYIEPALVTLMAVIAGMVLLSVMLPLLGIMSAI